MAVACVAVTGTSGVGLNNSKRGSEEHLYPELDDSVQGKASVVCDRDCVESQPTQRKEEPKPDAGSAR